MEPGKKLALFMPCRKSEILFIVPPGRPGAAERKKLEELFKYGVQPHITVIEIDNVQKQLDNLLKDRQVLSALA